jgi:hypothetical protein
MFNPHLRDGVFRRLFIDRYYTPVNVGKKKQLCPDWSRRCAFSNTPRPPAIVDIIATFPFEPDVTAVFFGDDCGPFLSA